MNQDQHHIKSLFKKFFVAAAFGLAMMVTSHLKLLPAVAHDSYQYFWIAVSTITLAAMIYSGRQFYLGAWNGIKVHQANMDTLVAMGTGAAWIYSTLVVIMPTYFPLDSRHVYFESALIILALINLGAALEARARGKTSAAIKKLLGLQPKTARLVRGDQEMDIPIREIKEGDIVRVRPGEQIPIDGNIIQGESHVDESMITGEPVPSYKNAGAAVIAGTVNQEGSFLLNTTAVGEKTVLAKIVELVKQAQYTKPSIGKLTDKISSIFSPLVLIIAILTALAWFNFGHAPVLPNMLTTSTAVLLIACPCALGLATPISVMVGIGRAAEFGMLIRNGEALQQSTKITTVLIDKTGTVTEGKPSVLHVYPTDIMTEAEVVAIAASAEKNSEHPTATAIVNYARDKNIKTPDVKKFVAIAGQGITCTIKDKPVVIGNTMLMDANNINYTNHYVQIEKCTNNARTPIFVAHDKKLVGVIAIADPIKPSAKPFINKLKKLGLKIILISGDHSKTANAVAKELGIDKVISDVLPENKAEKVLHLQQRGEVVAMVGDGINDAPALAQANVGIAIGTGTDIAIESADITLMSNQLEGILNAILLSKITMRNIKQNLFGAFFYNSISIPIAAGVLYPWFGVLLSPMIAGAAMAASSLTVVLNANRLRTIKLKRAKT